MRGEDVAGLRAGLGGGLVVAGFGACITVAYLARLLEKRLWSYHGRVNALGAIRLERDVSGIVNAAVDVGSGRGAPGRYRHRW